MIKKKKNNAVELEDSWCPTRAKCEKTPVSLFKSENVFVPDGLAENACSDALNGHRIYSYFEEGCWQKAQKCTRQSRKVVWDIRNILLKNALIP